MFRGVKPPRHFVQRSIQGLVRSFPGQAVVVYRMVLNGTLNDLNEPQYSQQNVFSGEALMVPAGGEVQRFGLGQVEEKQPQLLVPGNPDIRQGDKVELNGVRYRVSFNPTSWLAYLALRLEQDQQRS